MRIFTKEQEKGLEQRILANCTATASCKVRPLTNPSRIAKAEKQAMAEKRESHDLYYVETILCTAGAPYGNNNGGFNKNADFFDVVEVWRARSTPVHKYTNIGHIPDLVCGVMTDSWVLAAGKRKVVESNRAESDLPSTIHLACSAVIWRDLPSMYQNEINRTIISIEAGEMAVSMECRFNDFDYALLNEITGTVKIVERNDETSWMSWYLRQYGGDGIYHEKDKDGNIEATYLIGRCLRDITFSGKGYVTNPANPDSNILNKSFDPISKANSSGISVVSKYSAANGIKLAAPNPSKTGSNHLNANAVSINTNQESKTMSDNITQRELAEFQAKAMFADKLERENKELQASVKEFEKVVKANEKSIAEFEFGKKEYEQLLEAAKKENEEKDKKNKEQAAELEAAKKDKEDKEKQMKEKADKIEALEKELAEIKAAQVASNRQNELIKEGVEAAEAEAFVKTYASFNDEQFKTVAKVLTENKKAQATVAALVKDNKIKAEDLDKVSLVVDAKKDEKKEEEDKNKSKSQANIFSSLASAGRV